MIVIERDKTGNKVIRERSRVLAVRDETIQPL